MCLAPCFAGCTKDDYLAEVGRVLETLATRGGALTARLEQEREAASQALDFERAAAVHKRVEKVSAALRGLPELVRRIDRLDAVILQRATEDRTIVVFPVRSGVLGEALFLRFDEIASQPRPVEAILRDALEPSMAAEAPGGGETADAERDSASSAATGETSGKWRKQYGLRTAPAELSEHVSLVVRWFYSKPRQGEIFFRQGAWPYRRILRACARLLSPESPPESSSQTPPPVPPK